MPLDSRLSNPDDYLGSKASQAGRKFYKDKKVDYGEAFKTRPDEPPFTINRFDSRDLRRRLTSKKPVLNPRLNFVGGDPEEFKLFTGLPRFDTSKVDLYNFQEGRPNTKALFTQYPEFKPIWVELYNASPTVKERSKDTMPTARNPDPQGLILARAEKAAENQIEKEFSVAQLLKGKGAEDVKKGEQYVETNQPALAAKEKKDKTA